MSFFTYLKILKRINFYILPPPKCSLLIYDKMSVQNGFVDIIFKNQKHVVLDVRYESINLYILLLCILSFKFTNLKNTYKKIYIKTVDPKIVYTSIDNNPAFFNLKNLYSKPIYISDQNGVAKVETQSWPNNFSRYCKKFNQKSTKKLCADLIFVFNNNEKRQMSKIIKGKVVALGNTKCNNFILNNIKKKKKEKKKIIFINSGLYKETISKEVKIFTYLKKYSEKKNLKLIMLSRRNKSAEDFYRKKFGVGNWIYQPKLDNLYSSYKTLSRSNNALIIFSHSTLGFEALAIGLKCIILLHNLAKKNTNWKDSDNGFFWSSKINYINISKIINKIFNCTQSNWEKNSKKISNDYLMYDPGNVKKKLLIKKTTNKL